MFWWGKVKCCLSQKVLSHNFVKIINILESFEAIGTASQQLQKNITNHDQYSNSQSIFWKVLRPLELPVNNCKKIYLTVISIQILWRITLLHWLNVMKKITKKYENKIKQSFTSKRTQGHLVFMQLLTSSFYQFLSDSLSLFTITGQQVRYDRYAVIQFS